jgi:homoserine kinase
MAEVTVPATSANLGCAFDCAAVALDLRLAVEASLLPERGLEILCEGEGAGAVPADASNLVVLGIEKIHAWADLPVPGLRLRLRSQIPVGVGLGSSAAAIVAGLLVGVEIVGRSPDDTTLVGMAAALDGHPDNVAAAYLGGFAVAAVSRTGAVLSRHTEVPEDLRFIVVSPESRLSTLQSRAVLPDTLSREDAVHNLQLTALMVASAFSGQFDFQPGFFSDRWHQDRRAELLPGVAECLALDHPDLLGVCLSGAGPSVLAITRSGAAREMADQLRQCFGDQGVSARTLILRADNQGAKGTFRSEKGGS